MLAAFSPAIARMFSSQNGKEVKGRDKWAMNGAVMVAENFGDVITPKKLEKLLNTAKGKRLVVSASGLNPGSRAMDSLLVKMKKHLSEEGK